MRLSSHSQQQVPAWLAASEEEAIALAEQASAPTHNHPDAVAAAQAVVAAIWTGRRGEDRAGLVPRRLPADIAAISDALDRHRGLG
jgi:ADP-ribosylglycohydrolase